MSTISKQSTHEQLSPTLVLTAALKQELPVAWIREQGTPLFSFKALNAGAWHGSLQNAGVVVIITGVGLEASRKAALWIRDQIRPAHVVNLGSVGSRNRLQKLFHWALPSSVITSDNCTSGETCGEPPTPPTMKVEKRDFHGNHAISLEDRLPFPWPVDQHQPPWNGILCSSDRAVIHPDAASNCDWVDMEAWAQAKVFHDHPQGASFHTVKIVSDFCTADTSRSFTRHLPMIREKMRALLAFLKPDTPRISVVIPVHNRASQIKTTLTSVLKQTLPPSEIIVVNDGSTDAFVQAVSPFRETTHIIHLPCNRGVSHARNRGIREARHPWIALLDSDDQWHPEKLARQWQYLQKYPFYQIVQSEEIWIRNGKRVNARKHHQKPWGWCWRPSLERCLISPSAVLFQRSLFNATGGFDENLPVCEDYDLWIRLTRKHVIGLEPTSTVIKQGGHSDQLSRRYVAMDRFRVNALLKALTQEQNLRRRSQLHTVLRKKLEILLTGSIKRGHSAQSHYFQSILEMMPPIIVKADA